MKKYTFTFFSFLLLQSLTLYGQQNDSIILQEAVIENFQRTTPLLEITTSVHQIDDRKLHLNHPERLVESFNMIPGVKMEERSPGSYRLSLRGSTIRSPFGIRNVKIYFDDFILTDATGNAYLNLIEPQFIESISIMKGPQGGEYGAETGGVAVLKSNQKEAIKASIGSGSYHLFHENITGVKKIGNHQLSFGQSHYQSDSYREKSRIKRHSFILKDQWKYTASNELNLLLLYTDLNYQTPGGLTLQQMQTNRRQARLATPTLPSAIEQNTGIINKTFLGGINHSWKINPHWKQFTLIQSSFTDFKNPFISNFEERKENNVQGRLYIDYEKSFHHIKINTRIGTELGYNSTEFRNFDNNAGIKGEAQKFDDLKTFHQFTYINQHLTINNRWFMDASLSFNTLNYQWETIYPTFDIGKKNFKSHWLPQLGINYKLNNNWSVRGKIAKGISSPTTEEVRSSNQEIQHNLNAEYGWNKELGIRVRLKNWAWEITAFDYHLKDAIVRRQDEDGNDYFINSGGTNQRGIEFNVESNPYYLHHPLFSKIAFYFSGHVYDFKYDDYKIADSNFSNHQLPGISKFSLQNSLNLQIINQINITWSNYYNSSLYLNDVNSVKEKEYVIGQLIMDSDFKLNHSKLNIYFGINNIYNAKYSAGYDLNAFGNRFYNPAATTNFYFGTRFIL